MTIAMLLFIRHVWRGGALVASVNFLLICFVIDCLLTAELFT